MKLLSKKLSTIILISSAIGLSSQAHANQIITYNPLNEFHSPPPEKPVNPYEEKNYNPLMRAILQKDEEILEETELKYRRNNK